MAARSAKESDADHGGDGDDVFHEVGVSHFYGDNAKQFGGGGGGEDKLSSKDSIDNETLGGEVILDHDAGVGGGGKGGDDNVKAQAEKYSDVSSAGAQVQTDSSPGDLVSEGHHDGQLPAQSLLK